MTRVIYWRGARCFGGKKQARFVRLLGNITFPDVVVLAFNRIDFDWVIINVLECFHEDLHTNRLAQTIASCWPTRKHSQIIF